MVWFVSESIKCTLMYKRNAPSSFQHNSEPGGKKELLTSSIFLLFLYLRETNLTCTAKFQIVHSVYIVLFPVSASLIISLPLPLLIYHTDLLRHVIILIFGSRGDSCRLVNIHRMVPWYNENTRWTSIREQQKPAQIPSRPKWKHPDFIFVWFWFFFLIGQVIFCLVWRINFPGTGKGSSYLRFCRLHNSHQSSRTK